MDGRNGSGEGAVSLETRESWHCGYLPEESWRPCELPPQLGADGDPVKLHEIGVCPGYLVRLPAVVECAQAGAALEKGELSTFFPGQQAALLEGAMLSVQAFNLYEIGRVKRATGGGR